MDGGHPCICDGDNLDLYENNKKSCVSNCQNNDCGEAGKCVPVDKGYEWQCEEGHFNREANLTLPCINNCKDIKCCFDTVEDERIPRSNYESWVG